MPTRARKNVTTGISKVMPKASSMREANDRYSLMRICGATPMLAYSSRKKRVADREDDDVAEDGAAHEEEGRGEDEGDRGAALVVDEARAR